MAFTILRTLEQTTNYQMLRKVAEEYQVQVMGDERAGTFSCRGVEGGYQCRENVLQGKFAGHGVEGEVLFADRTASVTVIKKPFWLPESLLRSKIEEGLDTFRRQLAGRNQEPENR